MADRNVLVIEPDGAFAAELRGALEPYGFGVEVLTDGNEVLQRARDPMPDLVLLSVEPRNVGYAICNKLKKNNAWKNTPIVLMSLDATQETFDQHRKLKTHADEYLIKPFPIEELLQKVDQLIGLGDLMTSAPTGDEVEIPLDGADAVEEIALDDEELALMEEDAARAEAPARPVEREYNAEEPTTITLDENLDAEAEAAFASLTGSRRQSGAAAALSHVDEPVTHTTTINAYQPMREPAPVRPGSTAQALSELDHRPTEVNRPTLPVEALDVGLDEVAAQAQAVRSRG